MTSLRRRLALVLAPALALATSALPWAVTPAPAHAQVTATPNTPLNPTPFISALNPATVNIWPDEQLITVTGSGFVSGTQVRVDGQNRITTFVSATELRVRIGPADKATIGTRAVTTFNPEPGGGLSAAVTLTVVNPTPQVTSLSPSSVTAGGADGISLAINGAAFAAGGHVSFAGNVITPTSVTWNRVVVPVPADLLADPASLAVVVTNPAPGGGTSAPRTFEVLPPPNPVPAIATLEPASLVRPVLNTVTVRARGTGFVPGAEFVIDNAAARSATFISATELVADVPGTLFPADRPVRIQVRNPAPGGGLSNAADIELLDVLPEVSFNSAAVTVPEGSSAMGLRLLRRANAGVALTIPLLVGGTAVPDRDYRALPASVSLPAGDTSATIIVQTLPNQTPEPDRTVIIDVPQSPAYQIGAPGGVVVTIADDDPFARGLTLAPLQALREDATGPQAAALLQVDWAAATAGVNPPGAVAVRYLVRGTATPGVDYVALPGTVTVPYGQTSAQIDVTVLPDAVPDPDETIIIEVQPGEGYQLDARRRPVAQLTITDVPPAAPPPLPIVGFNVTTLQMREADAPRDYNIRVTRRTTDGQFASSGQLSVPIFVSGTATAGFDFLVVPQGAATILDGNTQDDLFIRVLQDDDVESTETIVLRLAEGAGYALDPATRELHIEIVDDDVAPAPPPNPAPALTAMSPDSAHRGGAQTITFTGTNFVDGARVIWNGTAVAATFVSPSELRATIPANLIATIRGESAAVSVENPAPGGGASAPLPFRIVRQRE